MNVRLDGDHLLPFVVGENHKSVHRTLDVVGRVLLGLGCVSVGGWRVVYDPAAAKNHL